MKRLEELGVGRPSTYASIISTIQDRGYVLEEGLGPGPELHRVRRRDPARAALPATSSTTRSPPAWRTTSTRSPAGAADMEPWLARFYFGVGATPTASVDGLGLKASRRGQHRRASTPERSTPSRSARTPTACRSSPASAATARTSSGARRGHDRASIPDDLAPDELTVERALELLAAPTGDRELGADPETGLDVHAEGGPLRSVRAAGRARRRDRRQAARRPSLFKDMDPATVTLEDVVQLLALPA